MPEPTLGDHSDTPTGDNQCFDSPPGSDNRRRLIRPSSQIPKARPISEVTSCIAYIRVSTQKQADAGHGLQAQREAVEAEAAKRGWTLEQVYSDSGISGARSDRVGLAEATMHAKSKRIPLVIPSLSRLGRTVTIIKDTLEDLEDSGCLVVSCAEQIDTSGACGRMVVNTMAAVCELERDMASERTRQALATIREAGKKTGGRHAPFGWDVVEDGTLVPNEDEMDALKLMLMLHEEGFTLRQIKGALETRGIKTKSGLNVWHAKTVRTCLHVAKQLREGGDW